MTIACSTDGARARSMPDSHNTCVHTTMQTIIWPPLLSSCIFASLACVLRAWRSSIQQRRQCWTLSGRAWRTALLDETWAGSGQRRREGADRPPRRRRAAGFNDPTSLRLAKHTATHAPCSTVSLRQGLVLLSTPHFVMFCHRPAVRQLIINRRFAKQ